jgi:hypothetical protein
MNAQTEANPDITPASDTVAASSALDRPFAVTFFRNAVAATKHEERYTLRSLAIRVKAVTATAKARLPWLKLARFGDLKSEKAACGTTQMSWRLV